MNYWLKYCSPNLCVLVSRISRIDVVSIRYDSKMKQPKIKFHHPGLRLFAISVGRFKNDIDGNCGMKRKKWTERQQTTGNSCRISSSAIVAYCLLHKKSSGWTILDCVSAKPYYASIFSFVSFDYKAKWQT